jgi:hypothetical protein
LENKHRVVDCSTPEKANAYIQELAAAKGKNFSANNTEGKRRAADSYQTPYSLTRLYIEGLKKTRRLLPEHNWLEPAADKLSKRKAKEAA